MMSGISAKALAFGDPGNKLKYNGKEEQRKEFSDGSGLEWLDYGARMYDNQIWRWTTTDQLAQRRIWATPYNYVQNNPLLRIDPNGMTDYTLNQRTGEIRQVGLANDDPDRIIKAKISKNGEAVAQYKNNGQAKVGIDGIEKGILKDGMNLKDKDNIISVGGKGLPTVDGLKSFTLSLSEFIGREIKGFSYSADGSKNASDVLLTGYKDNEYDKSYGSNRELVIKYGNNFSLNNFLEQFHTHPKGTGATEFAPEISKDVQGLQNDRPYYPNARFIILYRISGQPNPQEYDYTHEYRPKND